MRITSQVGTARSRRWAIQVLFMILTGWMPTAGRLSAQAPMSAGLARVLAETADGLRDGQRHWIVASPAFPYRVSGVFSSEADARASLTRAVGDQVFGPFLTDGDLVPPLPDPNPIILLGCKHMLFPIASIMGPPYCPIRIFRWRDLQELVLTLRTPTETVRMDLLEAGTAADAMFLSLSSIEKFVLPYYARVYGPGYARTMMDSITARASRLRP